MFSIKLLDTTTLPGRKTQGRAVRRARLKLNSSHVLSQVLKV
jgi:hypothetical protein